MAWILYWVKGGVVQPSKGTAAVSVGKDVWRGGGMMVVDDRHFDGDDGCHEFQEVYGCSIP